MPDENGDQTVSGGVIIGGKAGVNEYGFHVVDSGVRIENYGTLTITNCINAVTVTGSEAADVIIYPTDGSTGGKSSPTTFDAGIGVCAVTAFTSLTGLALLRRKRRDEE